MFVPPKLGLKFNGHYNSTRRKTIKSDQAMRLQMDYWHSHGNGLMIKGQAASPAFSPSPSPEL
jgi:hypothetical protein